MTIIIMLPISIMTIIILTIIIILIIIMLPISEVRSVLISIGDMASSL